MIQCNCFRVCSIAVLALSFCWNANADTLSGNLAKTTSGTEPATGNTWLTASFGTGATSSYLDSVTLLLANSTAGQATVSVYTDGGLKPGSLVGTLISPASYSSTLAATVFTGSGINLAANSTYWIVLKAASGKFDWAWTMDNTGDGSGYQHTWGLTSDAGVTWNTYALYQTQFLVSATPGSGTSCTYSLSRQTASIAAVGDLISFDVSTTPGCAWAITNSADWITATASAVSGSSKVRLTIAPNLLASQRTGTVTVAGNVLTVTQAAAGCLFDPAASSASTSLPAAGGSFSLTINTTAGCAWTASFAPSWLSSVTTTGAGPSVITFTAAPNILALPRTGSVQVGSRLIQVVQLRSDSSSGGVFVDVPSTYAFADQITLLSANGITHGCSLTEFCPESTTTRGQMATFVIRSVEGEDFSYPATPYFTDVPATHTFFKYIQRLRQLGITQGCSATTYCPDDAITRGQMAVFMVRARGGVTDAASVPSPSAAFFTDVPSSDGFYSYIQQMRQWGITSGCSATTYCPNNPATRGQMATFLIRSFFTP